MKKFHILVSVVIAALVGFTSCDDMNDCGCECSAPVIESVELLTSPGVDITADGGSIEAGSYIAVLGENLGNVTAVVFGDKTASLKPAYRTDHSLVFEVPTVTSSCVGKLITDACPTGFTESKLSVVIGAPVAYMYYNEFVPDGGTLRIKGANFVGDSLQVDFRGTDGKTITVKGSDLTINASDGSELYVKIPAGIDTSSTVVLRNASEHYEKDAADGSYKAGDVKQTTSPILFRDSRNVLAQFDTEENLNNLFMTGQIDKATDGSYTLTGDAADANIIANNYSFGTSNKYAVFNDLGDFYSLVYAPLTAKSPTVAEDATVFGKFFDQCKAGNLDINNMAVKFEINVPSGYPTDGVTFSCGFCSNDKTDLSTPVRTWCAPIMMSEISWNKAGDSWSASSASSFTTDGWMTVTIPMSEFIWNIAGKNFTTSAQNFIESTWANFTEADVKAMYGDWQTDAYANANPSTSANPTNHLSYTKAYGTEAMVPEDGESEPGVIYGGFYISVNPYDNGYNSGNSFIACIDNLRIVPNDGNGAIYPKIKYGKASQHYYISPRTSAYK